MAAEAALEAAEASDSMGDTADIVAAVTKVRRWSWLVAPLLKFYIKILPYYAAIESQVLYLYHPT